MRRAKRGMQQPGLSRPPRALSNEHIYPLQEKIKRGVGYASRESATNHNPDATAAQKYYRILQSGYKLSILIST